MQIVRYRQRPWSSSACMIVFMVGVAPLLQGQNAPPPVIPGEEATWPRTFTKGNTQVLLYQPQLTDWENYERITLTMAVAVSGKDYKDAEYGVLEVTGKTDVDTETRVVTIDEFTHTLRFPYAAEEKVAALETTVLDILPEQKTLVTSLDRLLAYGEEVTEIQQSVEVSLDPPPIYYSETPAILVVFVGEPSFEPIKNTGLMAGVNTNWDVIFDTAESRYYLLNEDTWLTSADLAKGPWTPAATLPADLSKLPDDPNWENIRKNLPGRKADAVPAVIVSETPAELIVTEGEPRFTPIPGTRLMDVSNSDSDLFYMAQEQRYYLLVAGRWFDAEDLNGPWTAATRALPEAFEALPDDEKYGDVLASVPGTTQAEDAVLLASVPQKAAVDPRETTATVSYQGEPRFEPIEQTAVSFALNTAEDVFLVNGVYYCCQQGVWFQAARPEGPWAVCTAVPDEIYRIPADHPKHNVTYVRVYESTPETVVVGYTSGYTGAYVAGGLLLFGAGILVGSALHSHYDRWHDYPWIWNPSYYSYGCRARYGWAYGGFYRGARCYGPWGGAGRGGYYNPVTGGWARGSYRYGPWGGGYRAAAYNPYTGVYRASSAGRGIYGSWQKGVIARNDRWVTGGRAEGWRGKVGWVAGSEGRGMLHYDTRKGSGTIIKGKNDTLFVGKDGNIYRRGQDGSWSKRERRGWEKTDFRGTGSKAFPGNRKDKAYRPDNWQTTKDIKRPLPGSRPATKDIQRPSSATRPATKDIQRPSSATRPATKDIQRPSSATRPATKDIQRPSSATRPVTKDIQRPSSATRPVTKDIQRPSSATRPATKDIQRPSSASRPVTKDIQRPTTATRPGMSRPGGAGIAESLNRDVSARARGNSNVERFNRSSKASAYKMPSSSGKSLSRGSGGLSDKSRGGGLSRGGGSSRGGGGGKGGGGWRR